MTIEYKNIAISEMLGAVKEQWYPPNTQLNTTGVYLSFPTTLYEYKDANGETKQYKWYPDNVRQHGDTHLKFHSNTNWQFEAIDWAEHQGFSVESYQSHCLIQSNDGDYSESSNCMVGCSYDEVTEGPDRRTAIFEALYKLSQHLKK